jgi:hypothetical protein
MRRAKPNGPPGINDEVLVRWLERIEGGDGEAVREAVKEEPAHVQDVPGTTIESLLKREGRQAGGRPPETDT